MTLDCTIVYITLCSAIEYSISIIILTLANIDLSSVQIKKEPEDPVTEAETSKDTTTAETNLSSTESTVNGLSSSVLPAVTSGSTSKTAINMPVQGVKRGSDGGTKQPPQKKKKQ